ncbi:MAG: NAD(P)-binding protein [Mycobacterium sp.]|nr:NAD(P)-binding protein [Mycobacterium sp.]
MSEGISTPASCERRPTVAVLGAGIAGLTAAQELAERGFVITVYEARQDERNGLGSEPAGTYPPVKLGGLAASQYSTVGPHGGSQAELRPFPGRRGRPRPPERAVAGEHGFRFFPAYYLHTWDLFQRIPVYQLTETAGGTASWRPTSRTIYDNVRRVVTQGTTVDGKPSLVFPRELPRSPAEFLGILGQLASLGFTPSDVATFMSRMLRYLVTSPLRRARELQNLSAYDYFVGHDSKTGINQFSYTPPFDAVLRKMPRVLAAFDSRWGDARTNITTYLQLYLNMDRRDNKADGVLNGPTTESWFDHWYRHLVALGVRFVHNAAISLDPPAFDPSQPPHLRPRVQITFADGSRATPDYTVVAVDAPAAEYITSALRAAGTGGTVARLDGFTTIAPPPDGPLQPNTIRPEQRRNPYALDEMGRVPWDRFQTLCGIQYYFDTEFQLLRGHMLYAGTDWALSSINQTGLWERRPILDRDGHVSVLSVDIGDFNTPSRHLVDELGRGKAARDCTPDEIAAEVWRQIISALTSNVESVGEEVMPWPVWYALDRGLVMATGPGQGQGRVVLNETPYLVPIVGDWNNRPSSDPWNPHGSSWSGAPPEDWWLEDLEHRNVWQARHGGYQVHNNSVVFAGTWNKTFTRMTSMEAACESGRHAVNAILDHYIWVASGGLDRRKKTTLSWEFPYGFLDQGLSSPIRLPTPAGDYCYVFDVENREPADTRPLRTLDSKYCEQSLPHPLDTPTAPEFGVPVPPIPPLAGGL